MYSINKSPSIFLQCPQVNKDSSDFQAQFRLRCYCRFAYASQASLCKSNLVEVGERENRTDITPTYLTMHSRIYHRSNIGWQKR